MNKKHYLIRISPRFPENVPSMYSSALASCTQQMKKGSNELCMSFSTQLMISYSSKKHSIDDHSNSTYNETAKLVPGGSYRSPLKQDNLGMYDKSFSV